MWLFKGMKRISKSLTALLMATVLSISAVPTALASNVSESETGQVVSHSEEWVSPNKRVEVTVYDLGDGFTATETITDEYVSGAQRASGTKTQTSTVEVKNGSDVAATITVSGTFSYDGSKATVIDYSHSKSIRTGYEETGWGTAKGNSGFLRDAYVSAELTVKQLSTSKSFSGTAKVTCSKNG